MGIADGKRSEARLAVVIAAAMLLLLLLAAPAMAAPAATSLVAAPTQTTVDIGDSLTISATLMDTVNAVPVDGATVRVEQATSNSGPWTLINYADNEGGNGVYSLELYPAATAYYRFVYAPDPVDTYLGSTSNVLTVDIRLVPTGLTASPGETTVTVGDAATLTAVLTDTDASLPIGGQTVRVEQATSDSGPWSLVQTVTNDGTTGSYSLAVVPLQTTYYRFVFAASDTYAASASDALAVRVKPVLGAPTGPTSIKKNQSFTVRGTVKPGAPAGPGVKILIYRKHDGNWSKYRTAYSTTRSGTRYSVKLKINAAGNFKFKAAIATSSKFVGVSSSYSKVLTVKK
jgi:5-hydroxyisourate hydrolase-like protein (transthyretin family)